MAEERPKRGEDLEPTDAPLSGPNVASTFDTPPRADARRAHDASIRMHLRKRQGDAGEEQRGEDAPGA